MNKPLTKKQLAVLGTMARKAWAVAGGGEPFDEWRQGFTFDAVGRDSWHACGQGEYIPLLNALRRAQGLPPVPDRTPKDDEAKLLFQVKDRAEFYGFRPEYVAAIVRGKFGRPWVTGDMSLDRMCAGLTAHQLGQLRTTLRNRGEARKRKEAAAAGLPVPATVHASRSTMPPPRLAAHFGDEIAD